MPVSRRHLLHALPLSVAPFFLPRLSLSASPQLTAQPGFSPHSRDVVVCIFQRGGVDGLNMIVPYGDSQYYDQRPSLGIAPPNQGPNSALDLDGFFGLHPAMHALQPLYASGQLAIVHATGSPHPTHSHFDATDFMERAFLDKGNVFSGWLGRHLESLADPHSESPFRAVGMGVAPQTALRGEGEIVPVALSSIEEFSLQLHNPDELDATTDTVYALYDDEHDLDYQAWQTLDATALLSEQSPGQYTPDNGAVYPQTAFGQTLWQVGQLIKTPELGLEVVYVDIGGWDTHNQEANILPGLLTDLSDSLAAFYTDMGSRMQAISIVTMSEFGRRAYENASGGTDHGHGSCMLLLGGGVNGGQVYADWPGLATSQLYANGDLAITTDWRTVLGELVQKRLHNTELEHVFPEHPMPNFVGIFNEA